MRTERLGTWAPPPTSCAESTPAHGRKGLPPPAALVGEWFGSHAVIAPTVDLRPVRQTGFSTSARATAPKL